MAYSLEQRFWCQRVLRLGFVLVCVCLGVYIFGRTLLWRLQEKSRAEVPCPSCLCDCFSQADFLIPPGLQVDPEVSLSLNCVTSNVSCRISQQLILRAGCGENDPDLNEELEKDTVALLSEEIALQKIVNDDTKERTLAVTMDAKTASLHYQKEAEKCNAGVETCEEARKRAEAQLREELKLTALWERRARQLGWGRRKRSAFEVRQAQAAMDWTSLELKLISCTDLKAFNFFQKLSAYSVVSINQHSKKKQEHQKKHLQRQKTSIRRGGKNPEWNHVFQFDLQNLPPEETHHLFLKFDVRADGLVDRTIGEVRVPLKGLIDEFSGVVRLLAYQVRNSDGKPNGVLKFSYKLKTSGNHDSPRVVAWKIPLSV